MSTAQDHDPSTTDPRLEASGPDRISGSPAGLPGELAPTLVHRQRRSVFSVLAASAWRALVLRRLAGLREGRLRIGGAGVEARLGGPAADGLAADIEVRDPRFWRRVALEGSLGAAEAYIDGGWDSDDLTAALRILVRNESTLERVDGPARLRLAVERLRHLRRRNDRAGARRNIEAHYDLGNDFFSRMLDPTMTYSCALWERPEATLEEASVAKLDRLCRKLALRAEDHLVEIGSGWGSMALHAAGKYGCRVTTVTLSPSQHALATERVRAAGLAGRVRVLLTDYRDLRGRYDKLVSVEMIEAVGADRYDEYFRQCAALLKEDGVAAIQAITIADRQFERARREPDFIRSVIFPGGDIPSITALLDAATRSSDLTLRGLEDIGLHYPRTLATWRANLARERLAVEAITTAHFRRLWNLYLCWCEAGFLERYISVVQLVFARPRAR